MNHLLPHISYSQWKSYTDCPRSWYLNKLRGAEEKQTWYLPIGSAVHEMIEDYVSLPGRDYTPSAEGYFYQLVREQLLVEPDMSKWLAGGPADNPIVEDKALQQVKDCFEKALDFLDKIDIWHVELDVTGNLPGLEIPVKAFVDVVGEHKKYGPILGDWKTGKQKPKNNFQLETYRALLAAGSPRFPGLLEDIDKGLFLMLNPASSSARPIGLSGVDPARVGKKYQDVYDQMKAKVYKTNAGFQCRMCFQQDNCLLNAGHTDRAEYYDRAGEEGFPF